MTPGGFIELTSGDGDGLPVLIARAEIALVRQAARNVVGTETIVILRGSGVIVPTATAFDDVVKRIATPTNGSKGT